MFDYGLFTEPLKPSRAADPLKGYWYAIVHQDSTQAGLASKVSPNHSLFQATYTGRTHRTGCNPTPSPQNSENRRERALPRDPSSP
jgi:hypothetical protein